MNNNEEDFKNIAKISRKVQKGFGKKVRKKIPTIIEIFIL